MWKKFLISLGYFFGIMLVLTIIFTVLDYFNLLSNNINSIFKFIIPILSMFVSSFILGINSVKKGYIEGIKLGAIIIMIFIIIVLLFSSFDINSILYYIILIITSTLGSMLGINKKKALD